MDDRSASRVLAAVAGFLALTGLLAVAMPRGQAESDSDKILGPDACGECHKSEVRALKASRHTVGYTDLHRLPLAKEIGDKLGIKRIKTEPSCVRCHYTATSNSDDGDSGRLRIVAGVACESCHGGARDWLKAHSDFGGTAQTRAEESPAHYQERVARTTAAGMAWPEHIDALATQCFKCHIIDDPELVEKGGHPQADSFELVAWFQGEVRHNFFDSDGKVNQQTTPERKRLMFVIGQGLDLEYSLRALAAASADGSYAKTLQARIVAARAKLAEIAKLTDVIEVNKMIEVSAASAGVQSWSAEHRAQALSTADQLKVLLAAFAKNSSNLAALDALLPTPDKFRGEACR